MPGPTCNLPAFYVHSDWVYVNDPVARLDAMKSSKKRKREQAKQLANPVAHVPPVEGKKKAKPGKKAREKIRRLQAQLEKGVQANGTIE